MTLRNLLFWLLASAFCAKAQTASAIFPEEDPDTLANYRLVWSATPGQRYEVWRSPDLVAWALVEGFPAFADGPAQQVAFIAGNNPLFFRVVAIDEQPPAIVKHVPADQSFAVRRSANISVELADATGIDPASIRFAVGGIGPVALDDPRLSFTNRVLTFVTGAEADLGTNGATVFATLVAADVLGNRGTNTWSFAIELEPQVVTNLFVFGSAQAQAVGQRLDEIPTAVLAKSFGPIPQAVGASWTLESVYSNRLILAYAQASPPAFSADTYVCNLTPATIDEIFYRKITSVSGEEASNRVTLFTVNVPLEEFVSRGSVAVSDDSAILETQANGRIARMISGRKATIFPRVGWSLDGLEYTLKAESPANLDLAKLTTEELRWWLTPRLEGGLEIDLGSLRRFEAVASGTMEFASVASLDFLLRGIAREQVLFDLPEALEPRRTMLLGFIGIVPIWATTGFDVKVKSKAETTAKLNLKWGIRQRSDVAFGVKYIAPHTELVRDFNILDMDVLPFTAAIDLEGSFQLSLEPALEFLVYGLAGFSAGITANDRLVFSATEPLTECGASSVTGGDDPLSGRLEAGVSLDLALAGPAFDQLNPKPELSLPLWSRAYPLLPRPRAISPESLAVDLGQSARFTYPDPSAGSPSYQWYHNGLPLVGETARTLVLPRVTHGNAGRYYVRERVGSHVIDSPSATLIVGMSLIPAGPFVMGDTFGEDFYLDEFSLGNFRNDAIPVHTVCISAFFMDRFEVTKALWDKVYQWALQHGYGFVRAGQGKAPAHPVHTVDWHDVVKWCNARSEMEGLTPCYYTDTRLTNRAIVYRNGVIQLFNANVNWNADGYRLPTEAEWEKAARGGRSGTRFSWGNTISHSRANYFGGQGNPFYDASSELHPAYAVGNRPFTSPAGAFPGNGYRLHDMAGNLSEWCWDWWNPYFYIEAESRLADTRGPVSATNDRRVTRDGGYYENAFDLKSSFRRSHSQSRGNDGIGFRCVRGLN